MSSSVTVRCPAKINLSLSVGPPGADRMHPIRSWMVAVSLYDDLTVERCEGASAFDIGWADDAPKPTPIDWPVEKDLIYKTWQAMMSPPVKVTLRKRIPTGAGMGGGSSDAGGMLRALAELFGIARTPELAARIGSDVPFFLGPPSAIVSGLGERVEPAPLDSPMFFTLILSDLHCNTAAVYRKFDELFPNARVRDITAATRTEGVLINDLSEAAFAVEPQLRELHDRCTTVSGKSVHVTGSGAGLFILQPDFSTAALVASRIREKCGVATIPVMTI